MKISRRRGGKHFKFLVILGKKSRLWLLALLYVLEQATSLQIKIGA